MSNIEQGMPNGEVWRGASGTYDLRFTICELVRAGPLAEKRRASGGGQPQRAQRNTQYQILN
jgi:hypothetical protein